MSDRSATQRQQRIATRLTAAADSTARGGEQFLERYQSGVLALVLNLESSGPLDLVTFDIALAVHHPLHRHFLTMLIADRSGMVVTSSPDSQVSTYMVLADKALYVAKRGGRNRVAFSTEKGSGLFEDPGTSSALR